jgi:hypothetical protein
MAKHSWTFFRAGGVDQVILQSGDDLKNLAELDQKLWVALACPIKGNELDQRSLEVIDTDKDGRIRPPEVLEAIEWSAKVFKSLDLFFEKGAAVPLDKLDDSTAEGKAVLASAKQILKEHGKKDAKQIELADVEAMEKLFVATKFNGDGIIPSDSADDDAVKKAIDDVISAVGSVTDRSAKPGIDQKLCDKFFEEAGAMLAWHEESRAEGVLPLGEATAAAAAALDRDFARLLNNYVSFTDFYARRGAIFQAGTLYLDGRACDMTFHVNDAGKHAKMAPMSNAYLAYVDCTRPGGEKMSVACAFTAGDSDNLFEGPQRHLLRPQGPRLGRDDHQDRQQPDQHPAGVLVALQAGSRSRSPSAPRRRRRSRRRRSTRDRQPRPCRGAGAGGRARARGARRGGVGLPRPAGVADAAGGRGGGAGDLRSVDAAGLAQAAPAQPRPAARRQRLGGQHACAHQHPLRRRAHRRRGAPPRLRLRPRHRSSVGPWRLRVASSRSKQSCARAPLAPRSSGRWCTGRPSRAPCSCWARPRGSTRGTRAGPSRGPQARPCSSGSRRATGADEETIRGRVYFSAVARCFPGKAKGGGGDRRPSSDEIERCRRFIEGEIGILRPKLVLPIGTLAIEEVLGHDGKLVDVIGTVQRASYHGVKVDVIALPHPSGASTWHRTEPGKTLLARALELVASHEAMREALG